MPDPYDPLGLFEQVRVPIVENRILGQFRLGFRTGFQPGDGPFFAMQQETERDANSRFSNISANTSYEIT